MIREIALYWYVYELTGSALALGILGLSEALPRLFLYPFVGVFVDRHDRLRLLIVVQFAIAIPVFLMATLYFVGELQFWHILVLEIIFNVIRSVNPSATQSIIRELVSEEELLNAVALLSIGFNIARVIGPAAGGVLISWIGPGGCFLTHSVSLVVSASAMLLIRLPRRIFERTGDEFLKEVRDGFRYIWQEPIVLVSIGVAYIISVFVGAYQRFLPVFAKEVLAVGPEGLGVLTAAPGVGALISLSSLATAGEKWRRETLLLLTVTATPVVMIIFCLSSNFFLSLALLTLAGAGLAACRTVSRVILQIRVPYGLLGRVMSVFQMDTGMRSVGSIVIGAFAMLFGAAVGLALASAVSLALTSALFFRLLGAAQQRSEAKAMKKNPGGSQQ